MRIAVLSESDGDEAAVRILVSAVLGPRTTFHDRPALRTRGWPSVLDNLPVVIRALHFDGRADGLIVVVDSNHAAVHVARHDAPGPPESECRLCMLKQRAASVSQDLPHVTHRTNPLRIAVGLAVPCLEAWFCSLNHPGVSEPAWINGRLAGRDPYSKNELKLQAYGAARAGGTTKQKAQVSAARALAEDLSRLEDAFPGGFGSMADELRRWVA